MIIATALSKNGVFIRLTSERWQHILLTHLEINLDDFSKIMKVITNPDFILKGSKEEFLAVKKMSRKRTWIVVPYKEVSQEDGFVLTVYFTSNLFWLLKKEIIWSKE